MTLCYERVPSICLTSTEGKASEPLDSIQLASILEVKEDIELLFSSDKVLASISSMEGIAGVEE